MRKEKKRGIPPSFPQPPKPTQEITPWKKKKKTPYPSQYHLIKLLYFSSLVKAHIKKKKNPLRDELFLIF
jgi:hypothetical protein